MEINKKGKLTIITGPMFAGKTEELLRKIKKSQYAKEKALIFKPYIFDNNYLERKTKITNFIVIKESKEMYDYLKKGAKVEKIFIDKLHFFDKNITKVLNKLAKRNYQIIATGLDQDFRGKPFKNVAYLLALAEKVIKLSAICVICKQAAHMTQRLINNQPASTTDPVIIVGKEEIYQARCRLCHVVNKLNASIVERS